MFQYIYAVQDQHHLLLLLIETPHHTYTKRGKNSIESRLFKRKWPSSSCAGHTYLLCNVKEAKQLEEARLKLAREQKKRQDMESAGRLAAQRKAAEQAVRQQAEADMKQKKADRQSRVCLHHRCHLTFVTLMQV